MGEGSALNGEAMEVTVVSAAGEVVPMFGGSGISRAHKIISNASELGLVCAEATEHALGVTSGLRWGSARKG